MGSMDIYAEIGYIDEADHITNVYPTDWNYLKSEFDATCLAIAEMNATSKKQVIECKILITNRGQNTKHKIYFDIINYYNYDFVNVLFYETNDNFALDCMRILAGDRYENNGVEVSYYVPIELIAK